MTAARHADAAARAGGHTHLAAYYRDRADREQCPPSPFPHHRIATDPRRAAAGEGRRRP